MATRVQTRRDSAANWASANPVLAAGEPGLETDTLVEKIGDGVKRWDALAQRSVLPWKPWTSRSIAVVNQFKDPRATTAANFTADAPALQPPDYAALATGTGGALASGWCYVLLTYVTAAGETLPSTLALAAVGAGASVTVRSPAPVNGVTGYYVYASADDVTFYRQQTAGSPTAIGTDYTISSIGTSGAAPPSSNTATTVGSIAQTPTARVGGFQQQAAAKSCQEVIGTPAAGSYVSLRSQINSGWNLRFRAMIAARASMHVAVAGGGAWHAEVVLVYYGSGPTKLFETVLWRSPKQTTADSVALAAAYNGAAGWLNVGGWDNMSPTTTPYTSGGGVPTPLWAELAIRVYNDSGTPGAVTLRGTEFVMSLDPNGAVPGYVGGDLALSDQTGVVEYTDDVFGRWLGTADNSQSVANFDPVGWYKDATEFGFNNPDTPTSSVGMRQTLALYHEMGVTVSREAGINLSGGSASPLVLPTLDANQIKWLRKLAAAGIKVILLFGNFPAWIKETGGYNWPTSSAMRTNAANAIVAAIAAIGPENVYGIEAMNEPNNPTYAGSATAAADVASFVAYSNAVHDAVHTAYPAIKFFGGVISAGQRYFGPGTPTQPGDYLKALYTNGLKYDVLDVHPYPIQSSRTDGSGTFYAGSSGMSPNAWQTNSGLDYGLTNQLKEFKDIMAANAAPGGSAPDTRPMFLTESGQLSYPERTQGQVLAGIYDVCRQDPQISGVCFNQIVAKYVGGTPAREWSVIGSRNRHHRWAARQLALMNGLSVIPQESEMMSYDPSLGIVSLWGDPTLALGIGGLFSVGANVGTTAQALLGYFGASVLLGGTLPGDSNVLISHTGVGGADVNGRLRVTGVGGTPTAGVGVDLSYTIGSGWVQAKDFAANVFKPLEIIGSEIILQGEGANPGILLTSTATANPLAVIKAAAGHTGPLLQFQNSGGGDLLDIDVAGKITQYEYAFSAWKTLRSTVYTPIGAGVSGTQMPYGQGVIPLNSGNSAAAAFYLDPADFAAGARTLKIRVRGTIFTGSTAPGVNFTLGLYPATIGSVTSPAVTAIGAALASVTFTAPGASAPAHAESAVATLTAGWYCFAIVLSGATAASSSQHVGIDLQYEQV